MILIYALRSLLYYVVMQLSLMWVNLIGWWMFCFIREDTSVRRHARIRWIQSFNRFMTRVAGPTILGLRYTVRGEKNISAEPTVYLMKHQSAWETIATPAILPIHTWVLKRELLHIPNFGWGLRLTDPIAIIRADPLKAMKDVAKEGKERIAAGLSIVVFPEGTRTPPGKMGEFKAGGAFLAKQCGVMVVPVAHNAGCFWPKNSFIKQPGTITVVIGRPIATKGRGVNEINARVERWMRRMQKVLERQI